MKKRLFTALIIITLIFAMVGVVNATESGIVYGWDYSLTILDITQLEDQTEVTISFRSYGIDSHDYKWSYIYTDNGWVWCPSKRWYSN